MANRALVMSGGGSRGAFQLGAADYPEPTKSITLLSVDARVR